MRIKETIMTTTINPWVNQVLTGNPSPQSYTFHPTIPTKTIYDIMPSGRNGNLIVVVLDESTSMNETRHKTISAFNEFLQTQKMQTVRADVGAAYMTLIKFSGNKITTVYENTPISTAPMLTTETYTPRGGTNLNDAIGVAVAKTNVILASLPPQNRPGVMFLIMTDGEENQSTQYNIRQIHQIVKDAEKVDWNFTFLGANIDAFAAGSNYGFNHHNTMQFNTSAVGGAMSAVSDSFVRMRSAKLGGLDGDAAYQLASYTSEERAKALKE